MTKHFLYSTLAITSLTLFCLSPASAGDSCSFSPPSVTAVVPAGDSVPVGTVIHWPFSGNPEGWSEGKWLECNGQSISSSKYPELYAVAGSNVPDLRGLFLRGTGGSAAALGSTQEDAGRNITASIETRDDVAKSVGQFWKPTGAFSASGGGGRGRLRCTEGYVAESKLSFDASRSWGTAHTASEFRPKNRSVRYLIRATP